MPCKNVVVSGSDSKTYFVPTKECYEWEKFRQNKPGSISVTSCVIPPNDPCTTPFDYMGVTYVGGYVGDQCWMTTNLNAGTTTGAFANDGIIQKRCYSNSSSNCTSYGGLYSWNEAMGYSTTTTQGICPTGWHLPTESEINDLLEYVGLTSYTTTGAALSVLSGFDFTLEQAGRQNYDSTFSYLTQQGWIISSSINPDPVNGGPLGFWLSSNPSYSWTPQATVLDDGYNYSVKCIKDSEFIVGSGAPIN